jgi:hypothetical protein
MIRAINFQSVINVLLGFKLDRFLFSRLLQCVPIASLPYIREVQLLFEKVFSRSMSCKR